MDCVFPCPTRTTETAGARGIAQPSAGVRFSINGDAHFEGLTHPRTVLTRIVVQRPAKDRFV